MKSISLLVLALAPFLSFADAVYGAPALVNVERGLPVKHKRLLDLAQSPWHKRNSKRQAEDGPPSAIPVSLSPADPPTNPTDPTDPTDDPTVDPTSDPENPPTDESTTSTSISSTSTSTSSISTSSSVSSISIATTSTTTSTTTTSSTIATTSSSSDSTVEASTTPDPTTSTATSEAPTTTSEAPTTTSEAPTTTSEAPTTISDPPPDTSTVTTTTTEDGGLFPVLSSILSDVATAIGGETSSSSDTSTSPPDPTETSTTSDAVISDPSTTDSTTVTVTEEPPPDTVTGTATSTVTSSTPTSTSTSKIVDLDDDIFPGGTRTDNFTATTTVVDSTTSRPPISIESQYQFITASSFLIAPISSSTTESVTATDPDAAPTTIDTLPSPSAATLTMPAIPSSIPMFITPPADSNPVPIGTYLPGYTEISILFQLTASWLWVLQSPDTAAQILAYMPPIIVDSLQTTSDSLRTVGLKAFSPADLESPEDLMTMYVAQLKTELVDDLSALIRARGSTFYSTGDPVAESIAQNVVMSYNIASLEGLNSEDGSTNTGAISTTKVDNSRRNAIIGVSVSFGLIAFAVIAWWIWKSYKNRREAAHKRLSYSGEKTYGTAATGAGLGGGYGDVRAESPPGLHNPFMTEREREEEARGIRRNSFYAIGPDDASLEEETFDYMSQRNSHQDGHGASLRREASGGSVARMGAGMANSERLSPSYAGHPYARRPIGNQPISQPILRESSMGNW